MGLAYSKGKAIEGFSPDPTLSQNLTNVDSTTGATINTTNLLSIKFRPTNICRVYLNNNTAYATYDPEQWFNYLLNKSITSIKFKAETGTINIDIEAMGV